MVALVSGNPSFFPPPPSKKDLESTPLLDIPSELFNSPDANPSRPRRSRSSRSRLLQNSLTTISHSSSLVIGSFLIVHLAAPVSALAGGADAASGVMILGREYYQTYLGERFILGSILAHVTSSTLKRLLSTPTPSVPSPSTTAPPLTNTNSPNTSPSSSKTPSSTPSPRPLSSPLTLTAYLTTLLLPAHFLTHRYIPSLPTAPIQSLGPSELDYEFVKVGLRAYPVRNWLLYGLLVGGVLVHAGEGLRIIANSNGCAAGARGVVRALDASVGRLIGGVGSFGANVVEELSLGTLHMSARRRRWMSVGMCGVLPVLAGVWVVSREEVWAFRELVGRYEEVWRLGVGWV